MVKRGRMVYVPAVVLDELDDLQAEKNISERASAFEEMANFTRIGREVERLAKLDFRWPVTRRRG